MTLVDYDHGKVVLRVMLLQKARVAVLLGIKPKSLISGDVDLGVPSRVLAALILYQPDAALRERFREFVVCLFTQFVPVT